MGGGGRIERTSKEREGRAEGNGAINGDGRWDLGGRAGRQAEKGHCAQSEQNREVERDEDGLWPFGLDQIVGLKTAPRLILILLFVFFSFSGLFFHVVGEGVVNLARKAENVTDKENYIDFRLRLLGEPGKHEDSGYESLVIITRLVNFLLVNNFY